MWGGRISTLYLKTRSLSPWLKCSFSWGLIEYHLLSVSIQHMYCISAMHPRTAAILFTALSKNGNIKSIFHLFEIFFNHRIISDVLLLEQNIWGVNVCNSKRLTGRNPQWWNYPLGIDKTFLLFLSQEKLGEGNSRTSGGKLKRYQTLPLHPYQKSKSLNIDFSGLCCWQ